MPDDGLTAAARRRLTTGGRRAQLRNDYGAAVNLFERGVALTAPGELDLALETELCDALFWAGRGADAMRRADALAVGASAAGNRVAELCGKVKGGMFRITLEPEGATQQLAAVVEQALPVFQAAGDEVALYVGYSAIGWVAWMQGQMDRGLEAWERAAAHARHAGLTTEFLEWRAAHRYYGTTTVSELLAWLENQPRAGRDYWLRTNRVRAQAMLGRFDEARAILAEVRAELAERGSGMQLAWTNGFHSVDVELLAGDPEAAAEVGAEGFRLLEQLGEHAFLPSVAGKVAQALYAHDRLEEADVWAGRAAELGASDDAYTQMLWRQVSAKVQARRGERAEAERLAHAAVAVCEKTDMLEAQGDVYADLAEVLLLLGKPDETVAALEQALDRYERKGNLVSAERVRGRIAELGMSSDYATP